MTAPSAPPPGTALVTGGSGYFGSLLVGSLRSRGWTVRVLDLRDAEDRPGDVAFVQGDITDPVAVRTACEGVDVVFHNVAQVPLARDAAVFRSVNVTGTSVLLDAALDERVGKVVYTSSSAVFGVPERNPVTARTVPRPMEAYGLAKYEGELLCRAAVTRGLDVSIIRPRTILGHGRLGIFAILFDWIADGASVPVLGSGGNRYQFVHADDLAEACLLAAVRPGPGTYNIGSEDVQTMRETLEHLCAHAGTGARVRSVPSAAAAAGMAALSRVGLAPFGPYHWMMYGREMWFDLTDAHEQLGWRGRVDTDAMFRDSYDWYLAHRDDPASGSASHHRSPARQGALRAVKRLWG